MAYQIDSFVVTSFEVNCYILHDSAGNAVVVDPGGDWQRLIDFLRRNSLTLRMILNTHGHADHICGNAHMKMATGAQIGIHALDAPMLESDTACLASVLDWPFMAHQADFTFKDGQSISCGEIQLQVLHTPGHTPGSSCFYDKDQSVLFCGDLVFRGSVGRYDLPGGSEQMLFDSLRNKFLPLPEHTSVLPGHGPQTSVGVEKRTNPFLLDL